jgi:predicted Zn-dependent protease
VKRQFRRVLPWAVAAAVALPSAFAFTTFGKRWPTTSITFYTGMPGKSPAGLTWSSAFQQAMQQWNDKTNVKFVANDSFVDPCAQYSRSQSGTDFPAGTGNLINSIDFRSTVCGNDFGNSVLAITLSNSVAGNFGFANFVETDIVFNDRQTWDVYDSARKFGINDFRRVALHELGHALGLGHESSVEAIMAPRITDLDQLQADDIAGADSLYAPQDLCPLIDLAPNRLVRNKLDLPDCRVNQLFGSGSDNSFVDVYRLKLTATTRLVFDMRSSELDSVLVLTDAKYSQLDIADDYAGTCNARLDRTLAAGEYRLLANTYAVPRKCVGNKGSYTLSISDGKLPTLGDSATTSGSAAAVLVTGGATADGGRTYKTAFAATDSIAVDAGIAVDPEHVGLAGKLFVLVQLGDGSRFVKTATGDFAPFSGNLAQLQPARSGPLAAQESLSIVKDLRGAGAGLAGQSFAVYVGYAIDSQPQSIHYGSEPIRFSINR